MSDEQKQGRLVHIIGRKCKKCGWFVDTYKTESVEDFESRGKGVVNADVFEQARIAEETRVFNYLWEVIAKLKDMGYEGSLSKYSCRDEMENEKSAILSRLERDMNKKEGLVFVINLKPKGIENQKGVTLVRKHRMCRKCGKAVPPHRSVYCSGMCKLKYENKHRKKK